MADVPADHLAPPSRDLSSLRGLAARRGFQKWAARFPLTRRLVRREGEALFDVLAGFCHAQALRALVEFDIPNRLLRNAATLAELSQATAVPADRMRVLLNAATALGLVKSRRRGRYGLTQRGTALAGVPGLQQMIRHHDVLYRDLSDPAAFFRGETEPELARFWPYVFGGDVDPEVAQTYSDLMAQSQLLVADDTLAAVNLRGVTHLMDVGGGTGAFLSEVAASYPALQMTLFDLPPVVPQARARFAQGGCADRVRIAPGSFRTDRLPQGADAISLVRVLYDHADETVSDLLSKCFDALPVGGRLIISEPMTGGARPTRAGDAYFALYTMAMGTGKVRSASEIADLCERAGFDDLRTPRSARPFVTSVVTGVKRN